MDEEILRLARDIQKQDQSDDQTAHEFMQTLIDRKVTVKRAHQIFEQISRWIELSVISG